MRVASLLPSATETIYALGVEPVCVSHSCDYPPAAREKPVITSTVIEHDDRSATAIDAQMQSVEGAVYDLDVDRLAAVEPDIVITQATCDICAVDASEVRAAVERLAPEPAVLALDPHSFDDVIADVRRIGEAIDEPEAAARLISTLRARVETIRNDATAAVDTTGRPRTAVLDWTDPPIRAGHWIRDMVDLAGGDPAFQPAGASEPISWDDIRAYDPEVLVVVPCGFAIDRAVTAAHDLAARPGFGELSAAEAGQVYAIDGNSLCNRPSHRLVESLEVLFGCVHPDASTELAVDSAQVRRLDRHAWDGSDRRSRDTRTPKAGDELN